MSQSFDADQAVRDSLAALPQGQGGWKPSSGWHRRFAFALGGGAALFPLAILMGMNGVEQLDALAFGVLIPDIQKSFGLNIQGILTLVSVVSVAALVLQVPIAFYADRWRRTRLALAGATAWALFSVLTGLAPTLVVLAIARAGSGIGKAVADPTHSSLLTDYYDIAVRPRVFGAHAAALAVGGAVGPLTAGLLGFYFGWRTPFIVFAIPTAVIVILGFRLKEPVRGIHERRAMGASEEAAQTEDVPPSFSESWRIVWQVQSLRRIWYSLPFLASAVIGLISLTSLYYKNVFHLDDRARGYIAAGAEPAALIGLLIGIPVANRYLARNPALALKFLAVVTFVVAGAFALFAVTPNLDLAIAMNVVVSAIIAVVAPGIYSVLSLAIPPKVRSMGFSVGALWVLPGAILLPVIGAIADHWGIRLGLLLMVPVFTVGGLILASSGGVIEDDIRRVWVTAAAQSEVLLARREGRVKLLLVKDLEVGYGGVQVLFGINLEIGEGEIVALLGTNGAGKSTLLKAISGLVPALGGAVVFDGRDMTYAPPHEIAARGVVQLPGGHGVFPNLTVAENFELAEWLHHGDRARSEADREFVLGSFPVLSSRLAEPAGNLSGGQQQMLALGMVFMTRPRLLMIDELSLGLAPIIVEQLLPMVRALRDAGSTIILVEQSVNIALSVSDTAYFMEKGEIRFQGPAEELLSRPDLLRSVFLKAPVASTGPVLTNGAVPAPVLTNGASPAPALTNGAVPTSPSMAARGEEPSILQVSGVTRRFGGIAALQNVTFSLGQGEILGIIGPNGAGKTTLFDVISGYLPADAGTIALAGVDITARAAHRRAASGLGRSFQDARLFPSLTVAETIAVSLERHIEVRDPVAAALNLPAVRSSEAKVTVRVEELIELLGLGAYRDKFVHELSTGSRRIVDLACLIGHRPAVVLFDEPSSGIAQRESEALGPLLVRIRDETKASLVVIEHDMNLLVGMADSMLALDLGSVVVRGDVTRVLNDPHVVASYLGNSATAISRSGARPN
ncbi:MAG: MFS transporter [Acidimicrobiales bacterium]